MMNEVEKLNSSELYDFLLHWCIGKHPCFDVLSRYFPPHTQLPTDERLFSSLLEDITLSQQKLDTETPLVTSIYSVVGALSIAANFCLLFLMFNTPYRSTTAVLLTILMVLNLHETCALLVNLYFSNREDITLNPSKDTTTRTINQFQQLFWSISCILIMLLVALDRWIVHNIVGGYLFRHHRKTKICCSLVVIVILVVAINHMLPLTVDIILKNEMVEVFVCISHSCHGSALLKQKWRSSMDKRMKIYLKCLQSSVALICLVFIPIYGCIWSAVSRKAMSEKLYEKERAKLTLRGQEIIYFNGIHTPKFKPVHDLPVIYEVDEENESVVDKGVMFPYTLNILHKASSLCALTKEDTCLYDDHPMPENARPLIVMNFVKRKFDTNVDLISGQRLHVKKSKPSRLAFTSKFPDRRSSIDFNRNALPPTSVWNKTKAQAEVLSQPRAAPAPAGTCRRCMYKKHVYHQRDTFSTRQIVFSINCCCNRSAPIDCHTEITYLNGGDYCETASSSKSSVGISRNLETIEETRKIISYKQTYIPVSGKPENTALLYDAKTRYTIPESHCLQMLLQEDSIDTNEKLNQRLMSYQHHGDYQGTPLPARVFPSCEFSEDVSSHKPATKSCEVTNQVVHAHRPTCPNKDPVAKHLNSQLYLQQCQVCKKYISRREYADANWNNDFLSRIKKVTATLRLPGNRKFKRQQQSVYSVAELPVVDFKTPKSESILFVVNEHYTKHSYKLKPIGIPSSLTHKDTTQKLARTKCTIARLMFLTGCYFVADIIPCLIELTILPHSTVLYMSSSFRVLMQFISLLIFSRDFKYKLVKCLYRKK